MRRLVAIFLLLGCGLVHAAELPETDWLDLMPTSDQKALEEMPEIDHDSPEAQGTFTAKGGLKQSKGLPAVMYSNKTVASMNGKNIRLGGYPGAQVVAHLGAHLADFLAQGRQIPLAAQYTGTHLLKRRRYRRY